MKILGITPARGGSKGIPRKNLKSLAGKPLLAWTVEHALQSKLLTDFVVSTEDPEIAKTARDLGAAVIDRPAELATDNADSFPVLAHAVAKRPAELIVMLQCTSPVRSTGLIDRCVEAFLESGADCLGAVVPDKNFPFGKMMPRRQEMEARNLDIGSVYVYKSELILSGDPYGKSQAVYRVSREEAVEIDDEFDFWLAEKILLERRPA